MTIATNYLHSCADVINANMLYYRLSMCYNCEGINSRAYEHVLAVNSNNPKRKKKKISY